MQPIYTMPVPPGPSSPDLPYYQAFVHAMNRTKAASIAEKLRHAITLTADLTKTSPAHIARMLVDYGLRAPKAAFPDSFVDYVESRPAPKSFVPLTATDTDVIALKDFWRTLLSAKATAEERVLENA
jgi:hypothetical protein